MPELCALYTPNPCTLVIHMPDSWTLRITYSWPLHSPHTVHYTTLTSLCAPDYCILEVHSWTLHCVHHMPLTPVTHSALHTPDPCNQCVLYSCPLHSLHYTLLLLCTLCLTYSCPLPSVHLVLLLLTTVCYMLLTSVPFALDTPDKVFVFCLFSVCRMAYVMEEICF